MRISPERSKRQGSHRADDRFNRGGCALSHEGLTWSAGRSSYSGAPTPPARKISKARDRPRKVMTDSVPLIDATTIERLTPMPALIAALRAAFANGGYQSPPRYAKDMSQTSSLLIMPSWSEGARLGVKIVNVDRVARPSVRLELVLMDRATARPLAILDGATLTRRRTAAASVLAATFLARPDSRTTAAARDRRDDSGIDRGVCQRVSHREDLHLGSRRRECEGRRRSSASEGLSG